MTNESILTETKQVFWQLFRVARNLMRLGLLEEEAKSIKNGVAQNDLYRMCIVFMHATLEDFIREFVRQKLPEASIEVLNEIPLAGLSSFNRPQKFSLGELRKHDEKNVKDLIRVSINEHLDRLSFNSWDEIAKMLNGKLKIDLAPFQNYSLDIDQMIKRRHYIVHAADLNEEGGPNSIDINELKKWHVATVNFILDLTPLTSDSADSQNFMKVILKEAEKELSNNETMTIQEIFGDFNKLFSSSNRSDNQ